MQYNTYISHANRWNEVGLDFRRFIAVLFKDVNSASRLFTILGFLDIHIEMIGTLEVIIIIII